MEKFSASFHESYAYLRELVATGVSAHAAFAELLEYCQTKWPHRVWRTLKGLDIEGDLASLREQIERVVASEPPGEDIKAFWFGLFNPIRPNGIASCGLYISGSTTFDPSDDINDWACWTRDSYLPRDMYFESTALQEIYLSVSATEASDIGEYMLCLGYASLAVKEITRDWSLPVAVGFDSGDHILVRQ